MKSINSFYSPNFDNNKRNKSEIKYLIFHYTGMRSEKSAIKRLCDLSSKVSCHYFIKKDGSILSLVPDKFISWHAGISSWKKLRNINKYSIGIEIHNPGHIYGYKYFNKRQFNSIKYLSKKLKKKYKFKEKNFLGHSDISPDRKKDPGEKFPWEKLSKHQIGIWHSMRRSLLKKSRLKKIDSIKKKIFLNCLMKIGYRFNKKNPNSIFIIVKAFQRRFRPQKINGKIDLECLLIAKNLIQLGIY